LIGPQHLIGVPFQFLDPRLFLLPTPHGGSAEKKIAVSKSAANMFNAEGFKIALFNFPRSREGVIPGATS